MSEFKRCSMCRNLCLRSNFHKANKRKDGVQRICIICTKQCQSNRNERRNSLERQKRKTDFIFKLICKIRTRTNEAFKSQNVEKLNKTFDSLGFSQPFFKRWIFYQLNGDMTEENYGKIWCLDYCYPLSKTNLFHKNEMNKSTNWINLRPMYCSENISKGDKIGHRLNLMQEVRTNYFLKLNV